VRKVGDPLIDQTKAPACKISALWRIRDGLAVACRLDRKLGKERFCQPGTGDSRGADLFRKAPQEIPDSGNIEHDLRLAHKLVGTA